MAKLNFQHCQCSVIILIHWFGAQEFFIIINFYNNFIKYFFKQYRFLRGSSMQTGFFFLKPLLSLLIYLSVLFLTCGPGFPAIPWGPGEPPSPFAPSSPVSPLTPGWPSGPLHKKDHIYILYQIILKEWELMDGWVDKLTGGPANPTGPIGPGSPGEPWNAIHKWYWQAHEWKTHCKQMLNVRFSHVNLLYSQPLLWSLEIQKGLVGLVLPVIEQSF